MAEHLHALAHQFESSIQPLVIRRIKTALVRTYTDVVQNHTMQMAAALSYYFVLSLFPALILLSAVVAYLPVPDLFNQALSMMGRFLPADSMGLVRRVLADVITPNKGTFLSFGVLGTLWAASGGFSAAIEAVVPGAGFVTAGADGALIFAAVSDFFEQLTARNKTIVIRMQAQIAGK